MHFLNIITTAALVGTSAGLAVDAPIETAVTIGVVPAPAEITAPVEKRDHGFDRSCLSSIVGEAFGTLTNSELSSAIQSNVGDGAFGAYQRSDLCTVTLPASLSDDYVSWLNSANTKYDEAISYVKGLHTKCGADKLSVSITPVCTSETLTALFTGAVSRPNATSTTTLARPSPATSTVIHINAAPGLRIAFGPIITVVIITGTALLL